LTVLHKYTGLQLKQKFSGPHVNPDYWDADYRGTTVGIWWGNSNITAFSSQVFF